MIKKLLKATAVLVTLVSSGSLFGQAGDYAFSVSTSTYVPLGASATAVDILADTRADTVAIGFDFYFEGQAYDSAAVASDGFLSFVVGTSSSLSNDLDNGSPIRRPLVAPLWDDHDGNASSSASAYEVTGTAPNRVFTFEWRDWEWNYGSTDSVVSFQVKLYETSNVIEFHYRWECSSCVNNPTASIGLSGATTFLSVADIETGTPTVSNTLENSSIDTIVTDQVFSFTPPACPSPSMPLVSNATISSLDVSWTASGAGPWYVYWGPCGFDQASSGVELDTVTTTAFLATGLASATLYEFRVFEDCGANGLSDTSVSNCANTLCTVQTLPYSEDFAYSLGCFTVTQNGGNSPDTWERVSDYGFGSQTIDGNPGFALADSDGAGSGIDMDEILESPTIDASGLLGSLILDFDQVYLFFVDDTAAVDVWDGTQWVNVLKQSSAAGAFGSPDQQSIDVTAYANSAFKVRFHYYNANWAYYWAIDNVNIHEVQCQPSSNLTSYAVASDSIAITWNPGAGLNYGVEYGSVGFTPGFGTSISTTDTFAIVTGLSTQTVYDFYVYDTCALGNSVALGPVSISTSCVKQSLPYAESFTTDLGCFVIAQNGGSTNDTWNWVSDYTDFSGPQTLDGSTGFAFVDSDGAGSGVDMDEIMTSPMVDASGITGALILEFDQFYNSLGDTAAVDVWDGTQWVNILKQYADIGAWGTPNHQFIDVTAYANADFQVRFHYYNANYAYYWAIDNFSLLAQSCGLASALDTGLVTPNSAELTWASNGSLWNIEWGPQGFFQGSGAAGGGTLIKGASSNPYNLTGLGADSCYSYYVQDTCLGVGTGSWVGPFNFCTPPTCPAPTNLGVDFSQLTTTGSGIYWKTGGAANFNIEYDIAGFTKGTGMRMQSANDTTALSMLNPGTEYEFYVRDSCSATDTSAWSGPFSFVTAFVTNYLEDFTSNTPFAWEEAIGRLTANTSFTSNSSAWANDDFGNMSSGSNSQRVNIWLANQYEWLISPSIYLDPAINNLQMELDVAVTPYASTSQGYFGADDSLVVVISTDNGKTWSNTNVLWYADATDTVSAAGDHVIVPLTGYSGYVKFGVYAGSASAGNEDNDWFVDNFEVRTPRSCSPPSALGISEIKSDSALVYWTEGTTGFINAEVIYTVGNQHVSTGTVVNSSNDSIYLSGLNNATNYCVYIVEECVNGFSDTLGPVCFTTLCLPQTLPYSEDFNTSLGCFMPVDGGGSNDTWAQVQDYNISTLDGTPFAFVNSDGAGSGITLSEKLESVQLDASNVAGPVILEYEHYYYNISTDSAIVEVYNGTSWVQVAGYSSTQGSWTAPAKDSIDISAHANAALQVRFRYEDNNVWAWYWAVDNVSIMEASACPTASNVSVTNTSCDSVEVSWTSDATATGSYIEYGAKGFALGSGTIVSGATSPVIINGLMLNAEYDVYVVDSCGMIGSNPSSALTFKTDSVGPVLASFTSTQTSTSLADAMVDFDGSTSAGDGLTYDWDFGNSTSGTGVNAQGTYTSNGTYSVVLTVTDRCGNTDDTTVVVTVAGISIVENEYNADIEMYPNPNNGTFNVNVTDGVDTYSIEVLDLSGRVVYQQGNVRPGTVHKVELRNKAKGVYMVRLKGDGLNVTQRMVID